MVTKAEEIKLLDVAESGVNLNVAAKLLHDLGWQPVQEVRNARLTLEDLTSAMSRHPVLIVVIKNPVPSKLNLSPFRLHIGKIVPSPAAC